MTSTKMTDANAQAAKAAAEKLRKFMGPFWREPVDEVADHIAATYAPVLEKKDAEIRALKLDLTDAERECEQAMGAALFTDHALNRSECTRGLVTELVHKLATTLAKKDAEISKWRVEYETLKALLNSPEYVEAHANIQLRDEKDRELSSLRQRVAELEAVIADAIDHMDLLHFNGRDPFSDELRQRVLHTSQQENANDR